MIDTILEKFCLDKAEQKLYEFNGIIKLGISDIM